MHSCRHVCLSVCLPACLYVCVRVCMFVCLCIYLDGLATCDHSLAVGVLSNIVTRLYRSYAKGPKDSIIGCFGFRIVAM